MFLIFLAQLKIYVYFCISKANSAYYQRIGVCFRFGWNKGKIEENMTKLKEKVFFFCRFFGKNELFLIRKHGFLSAKKAVF